MKSSEHTILDSIIKQFEYYESLGKKAMEQISMEDLFWRSHEDSNSIAIIVKHLNGNMLSRWTDVFNTDGEKPWRNRDDEFCDLKGDKEDVMKLWSDGWACLLSTLKSLSDQDLDRIIYIRNEGHTVLEAINRQLCHYSYHVGQIVFIARMLSNDSWNSLSIPKNASDAYNQDKFNQRKSKSHFTDQA